MITEATGASFSCGRAFGLSSGCDLLQTVADQTQYALEKPSLTIWLLPQAMMQPRDLYPMFLAPTAFPST